jgi:hypothetical protein
MKWAIYASGFREERGKHTGTKTNAHQVEMLHQTGECRVRYVEWNDDPEGYARSIADQWTLGDTIILTGYSWGAGNWVKKFLWTLYGINPRARVAHVLLIDPVVRSPWPWMRWLAVSPWGTIQLPPNIGIISGFKQRINEPNCSKVRIDHKADVSERFIELPYTHTKIDNASEVTAKILDTADRHL